MDTQRLIPPPARPALAALAARPGDPVKLLIVGGTGSGKSAVVDTVRGTLRDAGATLLTRPPRPGDPPAPVVVDDAQLLDDGELAALTELVADPAATVVVATEPQRHRPSLRQLVAALQRANRVVALRPLIAAEVAHLASATLGAPAPRELVHQLLDATAGLPLLLDAALGALQGSDDPARAARRALVDRVHRVPAPVTEALLVVSLGAALGAADVAAALAVPEADAEPLVDAARASGLADPAHPAAFVATVHAVAGEVVGAARHRTIESSLIASQLAAAALEEELALRLAEHGTVDERLAAQLQAHASAATEPMRAARLYRAAVSAGATAVDVRLADALALTGDFPAAARLADGLLAADDEAVRGAAVRIAASIAAHEGAMTQAAELFGWLGPHADATVNAAAVVALLGAGELAAARRVLEAAAAGPPTAAARAARSLAAGVWASLREPYPVTVSTLGQAVSTEVPTPAITPDTPAAIAALVALHGGDPARARGVLARPADDVFANRHRLLLGWAHLFDGQLMAAIADSAAVDEQHMHRRDALWSAALRCGIARRTGDDGGVRKYWAVAAGVLDAYAIDLYALLPLGELWVSAVRLGQTDRVQHVVDRAFALLRDLGEPPLWAVPLRWAGVHAGILANAPDAVAPHGQALAAAAGQYPLARVLAGAGRVWLRVLAGQVDADDVAAAARALAGHGHTWDATRLASQAALHAADARTSAAMLQLARDLKGAGAAEDASATRPSAASPVLSEREREVAELLVLGLPYRDIGSQLFISAKTVEHHVARIRRRLGAQSRSELLSMLRSMLSTAG
ncbi:isoniazid response ATPase/transcriptional regulator IniR [Mycobacterium sp. MYCO198283]|uniref:isoniazid response ATPase/transcriptional regulator IniR n=1 Tax=Mycobacterium sp. MYCO198283 TaxID=2883505 RepID=UPI001E290519|nr:isoniazid response ATPase/transcriptional regulator IniR [Mycobacterium sp. MYCO198283]MCG5432108.1 isoniazid response ATPase/transcriptional regulator IniR [Mycobacterium sp. MYCO198283]